MARSETTPGEPTLIAKRQREMSEARSLYRRYKNTGQDTSVPREVRERLATALMDYYDSLYQYHQDDQRVKQAWEEYDIEKIERFDAETVEIDVSTAGDTAATRSVEQPKLVTADPELLVKWSKYLDYFANKLGIGEDVDSSRPKGRIGGAEMYE